MDPLINPAFLVFSAIAPLLISLVKQQGFSNQINALIAFACYVVVGIAGVIVSGQPLVIENAVELVTLATVVGSAAYNLIWTNIGSTDDTPNGLDEKLTNATSVVK